ncbi:MAG: hypothetical protein P4L65_06155 [Legionella sp.]|nr:hypothetical protein [Legionella sp.]
MPMSQTVAEYLKQINMEHTVPENDPLLLAPCADFTDANCIELITLIKLYNDSWIDLKKEPKPESKLGEISSEKIKDFYMAALQSTQDVLDLHKQKAGAPLQIPSYKPKSFWISPLQITHWVATQRPIYQQLFHYEAIQDYSHNTIEHLLLEIGIELCSPLDPVLTQMLTTNLNQVVGILNKKQISELLYYTLYFIFNHAKASPMRSHYVYADVALKAALQKNAQQGTKIIDSAFADQAQPIKPLLENNLMQFKNKTQPLYLGLLCFDNCPLLKKLFIDSWQALGIKETATKYDTLALFPSSNPFVDGKIIMADGKPTVASLPDATCLSQMMELAHRTKSSNLPFFTPENNPEPTAVLLKFESARLKITDKTLRETSHFTHIKESATFRTIINYSSIIALITTYKFESEEYDFPPREVLKHFFATLNFKSPNTFNNLMPHVRSCKLFIDETNTLSLKAQSYKIEHTLDILAQHLKKLPEKSSALNQDWVKMNLMIWTELHKILKSKLELLPVKNAENLLADMPQLSF